ncbi:MAG: protein kinase domain-containing protein [Pyrinomonadaceae bacterium]
MIEGQTIGHYRVLGRLGEGGMGVVYLAEDMRLARRVAIKFAVVTEDELRFRARFLREARALSALNHPHIATVHDYGETADGEPFIVMELIEGRDLHELIEAGEMNVARAVGIAIDVAGALAEAHRAGIVHRDIKPSNVMLNARGEVKVLDFGLAKQLPTADGGASDPEAPTLPHTRTRSGVIIGTPLYLSPEQAAGGIVDGRSDLYALASVLYECLTGRPAFPGATVIEICAAVMHVEPPPPSRVNAAVPPELDAVVLKALAKRPEARYQSADEFAAALRACETGVRVVSTAPRTRPDAKAATVVARPRRTLPEALRRPRFSPAFVIAILLALGGATLGVRWLMRAKPHTPPPEAQHWYQKGEEALRDGTYYQARKALELAINIDPNFALAHARLAEAFIELGNKARASDELLQAHSLIADRSSLEPRDQLYVEAVTAVASSDYAKAIEKYQAITRLSPENPQGYVDLGRAYEKNNDVKNATTSYEEAARRDQQYATPYLRLGMLYGRQGKLKESNAAFDTADKIYLALGIVEGRAQVHYQRGFLLLDKKQIAEADQELQQARELAHVALNETLELQAMLQLSSVQIAQGDTMQAQQLASEAVERAKHSNMQSLAMNGLIDLGNAFYKHGDLTNARQYFGEALNDAIAYKDTRLEARARFSLGSFQINTGSLDDGLANINLALDYYQKGGYRNESNNSLILIRQARRKKGEYAAVLEADSELLRLAEQSNSPSAIADAHNELGKVFLFQEKYPEALEHLKASCNTYGGLGNQNSLGYCLVNQGDVLWQLGRDDEAAVNFDQAFSIASRAGGSKSLLVAVYQSRAEMALSKGQFPLAGSNIREALRRADEQDTETRVDADRLLGLVATRSGDKREGLRLCAGALDRAKGEDNQSLRTHAQLALAEALLGAGEVQQAQGVALEAQQSFARAAQRDSEWRAWLVAARASQAVGDAAKAREYATNADAIVSNLERQLSAAGFPSYGERTDVRELRAQLGALLNKFK